jgi:hypothetical protein
VIVKPNGIGVEMFFAVVYLGSLCEEEQVGLNSGVWSEDTLGQHGRRCAGCILGVAFPSERT